MTILIKYENTKSPVLEIHYEIQKLGSEGKWRHIYDWKRNLHNVQCMLESYDCANSVSKYAVD